MFKAKLVGALQSDAHRLKRDRRTVNQAEGIRGQLYRGDGRCSTLAGERGQGAAAEALVPFKFGLGEAFQFAWIEKAVAPLV